MKPAVPLYPTQERWVRDPSRFKIGMMSRQYGKTFATTLELVDDCFEHAARGERTHWVILSRGERQALEAMTKCVKPHCRAYGMAFDYHEYDFEGEDASYKAHEVTLPKGSRITALPANPDTARGFSANVLLDEFAFHKNSRAIWTALFPVISRGYKLRVISTPNGKNNKFYELWTAEGAGWAKYRVDIHQAVREGAPFDVGELRAAIKDEDAWAQEYECRFIDEATAWLPYELIFSCEHPDAGAPERYAGGPVYIGNDIGRRKDLWVAWAWEQVGDVLWTREVRILKRATFQTQDAALDELERRYRMMRLAMDQTGMGEKPVEDARRRYGSARTLGVLFTGPNKLLLARALKQAFEDGKVRIPEGDAALRADLHAIKKAGGDADSPRFVTDRDTDGHADRFWAGALGVHAAATGAFAYDYTPAPPSPRYADRDGDEGREARRFAGRGES